MEANIFEIDEAMATSRALSLSIVVFSDITTSNKLQTFDYEFFQSYNQINNYLVEPNRVLFSHMLEIGWQRD